MKIKVDLRTRVLAANHNVVMIRPGANYHMFSSVVQASAIAPDLASLSVPDGVSPKDHDDLDVEIRRARAIKAWAKTSETRSADAPSPSLQDYRKAANPAMHGRFVGAATDILWNLPAGTLVFVPNASLARDAFLGELVPAEDPRVSIAGGGHYSGYEFQGRRLVNTRLIPMRNLPFGAVASKSKNTTVVDIVGRDRTLLYRKFYGDFELLGRAAVMEVETTKPKFTGTDAAIFGALATMVQDTWDRYEASDFGAPTLLESVFMDLGEKAPVIHANLNSEGNLLIEALSRTPHVVKVVIALCLAYSATEIVDAVNSGNLEIFNSARAAEVGAEQEQDTREFLFHFLQNAGHENVEQIVEQVRASNARTGANVDAVVTDE